MPNATEPRACLPAVLSLVNYLRSTGTGEAKLSKLTELGRIVKDLDQFVEMAINNVPLLTMEKIDEYIGKQLAPQPTEGESVAARKKTKTTAELWAATNRGKAVKQRQKEASVRQEEGGEELTETRSNTQTPIPDHTVLLENRAPVLKEGGKPAKPLGADVVVSKEEKPGAEDDEEEKEEKDEGEEVSELADMSAEEARDAISRMTSKEKLEKLIVNEKRTTVSAAAQKRLDHLEGNEEENR